MPDYGPPLPPFDYISSALSLVLPVCASLSLWLLEILLGRRTLHRIVNSLALPIPKPLLLISGRSPSLPILTSSSTDLIRVLPQDLHACLGTGSNPNGRQLSPGASQTQDLSMPPLLSRFHNLLYLTTWSLVLKSVVDLGTWHGSISMRFVPLHGHISLQIGPLGDLLRLSMLYCQYLVERKCCSNETCQAMTAQGFPSTSSRHLASTLILASLMIWNLPQGVREQAAFASLSPTPSARARHSFMPPTAAHCAVSLLFALIILHLLN